ncbi:MAG: elongation factor 4, partial [Candidatus Aenigmarchaeota archaeon]|nr:elongation factor 4 [Candidatus Aenigmarchaeota archaeon]
NDASFVFEPERSNNLGLGFRCGFLGLLHLDIVRERLKREYDLDLTITSPSVAYRVTLIDDQQIIIKTAEDFPSPIKIKKIEEPWLKINLVTPQNCLGQVMSLIKQNKGEIINTHFLFNQQIDNSSEEPNKQCQVVLDLEMPLSLLLVNFYDKLKSISSGYASYSYELLGYRITKVSKLDILIAEEKIVPLSRIVYQDRAYAEGRILVDQLKKNLPRQQFEIKIQAVVNGKIIAAERLSALRKDVTAKLYGGDISRKMKLLKKQKKGKKRMRQHGKVYVPTEIYVKMLTINK